VQARGASTDMPVVCVCCGRACVRLVRGGTHQLPHLVTRGVGTLQRRPNEVHLGVHAHLRRRIRVGWRRQVGRNIRNPSGLRATPEGKRRHKQHAMSVDTTVGRCIRRATLSLSQWRATRGSGSVEVGACHVR